MFINLIKLKKHIPINVSGIDYFVGDIHGNKQALLTKLTEINFNYKQDRLFAVGDIIDRGEDSVGCIDLLIEPWFFSVLGNHEEMYLRSFDEPLFRELLVKNGGSWVNVLSDSPAVLLNLAHLVRLKMPLSITVETEVGLIGITHADAPNKFNDIVKSDKCFQNCLWFREDFNNKKAKIIKDITLSVHGHNSVKTPTVLGNQVWIDTYKKSAQFSILSAKELNRLVEHND